MEKKVVNAFFVFHNQDQPICIEISDLSKLPSTILHSLSFNQKKYQIEKISEKF